MRASLSLEVGRAFYGAFKALNPAQRDAVEPLLLGLDVIVLAGTGSGKTEAVLAPIVQRWLSYFRTTGGCRVLYVTPTRALANDLVRRIGPPLDMLGVTVGVRHGERNDLGRAQVPNVLITTPESLDVLLTTRAGVLHSVRSVVIDEIHLTYNTQRGFQLAVLLKRLEHFVECSCQVAGLSATVATPSDIWDFFRPGRQVVSVTQAQTKPLDAHLRQFASEHALVTLIEQLIAPAPAKVLLFCNSRRECDRLAVALRSRSALAESVFVHHSSLDRDIRITTERRFQEGARAVCVATSTLELGIDIGDIDLVMLYGHPGGWESFLQRVGRGNRRATKTNIACVVSPDHGPVFRSILAFEALLAQIREGRLEREPPLEIYGTAVQQMLSFVAEKNGTYVRLSELLALFEGWSHLGKDVAEAIISELARAGYLIAHDFQARYGPGPQLHRLRELRMIWGNFPLRSREIALRTGSREIGKIPSTNLLRIAPADVIRFAGTHWVVHRIRPDFIEVAPTSSTHGVDVSYGGSAPQLDPTVVEEMLVFIASQVDSVTATAESTSFSATLQRLRRHIARDRLAVARDADGGYSYFTFAGRMVNGVIARWAGLSRFENGDIVLRADQPIDLSCLPVEPRALERFAMMAIPVPEDLTLFQSLLPTELLSAELRDAWLKTPVYKRSLQRLQTARVTPAPLEDLLPLGH